MDKLDGLKTFVAVVESGSFTAAGKRLGISNKLVSKYIGELEAQLKVSLLFRTTRSLSLTNEGRIYLEGCRKVLNEFDVLERSIDPSGGFSGPLKIATPLTLGDTIVPQAAIQFMRDHPEVSIELDAADHYVDLAEGGYDLAIRMGPLKDSSLIARKLATTNFCVVASPEYLAKHGEPDHPAHLVDHCCVKNAHNIDPNHWSFQIEGQLVQIPVSGTYSANSAPACLAPVYAGLAIYRGAEVFLEDDLQSGRLVQILKGFRTTSKDIHAVHLPSNYRNPKVAAFIELLVKEFK